MQYAQVIVGYISVCFFAALIGSDLPEHEPFSFANHEPSPRYLLTTVQQQFASLSEQLEQHETRAAERHQELINECDNQSPMARTSRLISSLSHISRQIRNCQNHMQQNLDQMRVELGTAHTSTHFDSFDIKQSIESLHERIDRLEQQVLWPSMLRIIPPVNTLNISAHSDTQSDSLTEDNSSLPNTTPENSDDGQPSMHISRKRLRPQEIYDADNISSELSADDINRLKRKWEYHFCLFQEQEPEQNIESINTFLTKLNNQGLHHDNALYHRVRLKKALFLMQLHKENKADYQLLLNTVNTIDEKKLRGRACSNYYILRTYTDKLIAQNTKRQRTE